tara:strand:+ start:10021 stop:11364 length:1344 start_codon:yes stop_codon:yes gene_type:complete
MKYIIVGAGPTGLSLAYLLSLNNISIDLIEQDSQLGGSWNSQWIDDKYWSENSPRVFSYTDNVKKLMTHIGLTKGDFEYIYGNYFQTNYKVFKFIAKHFTLIDYIKFLIGIIKYKILGLIENITVKDWLNREQLSVLGSKAVKIISILICDKPENTNLNDFFGSVAGVAPTQMQQPNKWHELIEGYLNTKSNVRIFKNYRVTKLYSNTNNLVSSAYIQNIFSGSEALIEGDKFVLCTQSNSIYPIIKNSSLNIRNNWMDLDKFQIWSDKTYYSGFGFQLHFNSELVFKNEWCWSCIGDWTVIILPVSNWLTQYSKDPNVKTVWSCCIVDMDTKSKRINKTANECTKREVIEECLAQINDYYKTPNLYKITTSQGLFKINNKWVSKNTGYTKNIYQDLKMKGKMKNLYALGCFTESKINHIAYIGSAINATADYLLKYEKSLNINIFK